VLVQQPEQLHHGRRRKLEVLVAVEPDALAGKAQVERLRAALVGGELVRFHGLAAGGARGQVLHGTGGKPTGMQPW